MAHVVTDVSATKGSSNVDSKTLLTMEQKHNEATDSNVDGEVMNASGHIQELEKHFSFVSLVAAGITVGDVWPATAGTVAVALYNGGSPGVIFEFLTVCLCYLPVTASLAELASSMPSSTGLYQWATVSAGPKWGRMLGFYTGYWNYFQWICGSTSMAFITCNQAIGTYAIAHPDYEPESWHTFVGFLVALWSGYSIVLFGNRLMPIINNIGVCLVVGGLVIMLVICSVMPGRDGRPPHASSSFVWTEWINLTGWPDAMAYFIGMLNGAFSIGAPDVTTHLAEEIPQPHINIPKAMAIQMISGTLTALAYLIAILYCVTDFDILVSSAYPLSEVYRQATRSQAGTIGLMVVTLLPVYTCLVGSVLTASRALWILGRDNATPFSTFTGRVHPTHKIPFNATLVNGCLATVLGTLYLASPLVFNALVSSYVQLSSTAYIACILPLIFGGRKHFAPSWFSMRGRIGMVTNIFSVVYLASFVVIYSFPTTYPTTMKTMNWSSVVYVGISAFITGWWLKVRKTYVGPVYAGAVVEGLSIATES